MSRLFRDPIVHFAALGLVFFAVFFLLNEDSPGSDDILVSAAQQEQLAAAFSRVWHRPPDAAEFKGLIDDWLREELANREARTMGLADNDLIIRRRLRQKYEALMDQTAASVEGTPEALLAWYQSHRESYRLEPRYSLRQRFFSRDLRDDARADAQAALDRLSDVTMDIDPKIGDKLAMPLSFDDNRQSEFASRFGDEFAAQLDTLPSGRWTGPVPSAYGYHLVFVAQRTPARLPAFAEVEQAVLRDWRDARLREARDALYKGLLKRYKVSVEPLTGAN
jgi:hypothetical protein